MKLKFSTSKVLCVLIFSSFLITQLVDAPWNRDGWVVKSDIKGYYAYLPALFINNDLKLEDLSVYEDENGLRIWYKQTEKGVRYIKYTIGTPILYAPFFGLGHAYAGLTGQKQDGFSKPYLIALSMSSLFYLLLALIFLRRTLLFYFSDSVVALTLLVIFFGTNTWNYFTFDACFSHAYSFSVITMFIYTSILWLNTSKRKYALWSALLFGLMILIRPIDIIFILFPLLFNVSSVTKLKERFKFFYENKWSIVLSMIIVFICLIPQFIYFKIISDQWFFYAYTDEGFFFNHPKILEAMFSFRNGWLLYSPLWIFSLIGLFMVKKKNMGTSIPIFLIFLIYTWVISSWWCWWYVGFGNRAFINLYPFLSFPLAIFITYIIQKKWWWKTMFGVVLIIGLTLSIFQTLQFNNGAIHYDSMSKRAYTDSFLRWRPTPLFETYLEFPNERKVLKGESAILKRVTDTIAVRHFDFEKNSLVDTAYSKFIQTKMSFKGQRSLFLPDWIEYQINRKIDVKNANRIYVSAWVKNPEEFNICLSSDEPQFYALSGYVIGSKNGWDKIELYAKIPEHIQNCELNFYVWKMNRNNAYIDDIKIVLTHEKLIE